MLRLVTGSIVENLRVPHSLDGEALLGRPLINPRTGQANLHVNWSLEVIQAFFGIDCSAAISMDLSSDPTDPANILKTSGRGIFLMRTFMDEVEWFARPDGGTTVRLVKRF